MKRFIPVVVVALAVTMFWYRDLWLPQPAGRSGYLGYIEGETILMAAPIAGRVVSRPVERGALVTAGTRVFSLDRAVAEADVSRAEAALEAAAASYDNLLTGKRAPELAEIEAQRREAEANLALARKELTRARTLANSGTAAQSRLDTAETDVARYEMRVAQADAAADTAALPARDKEIEAARAHVAEAQSAVAAARHKLSDLEPRAPRSARVEDTFFEVGEWVNAGQPVVSLLPPEAVKLRFFVPEPVVARAQPGTTVTFTCDGCGEARQAVITSVASVPEYTPPVIYSQEARSKLVFRVEARPVSPAGLLPGLPVAVAPLS
ncbi:MAG: HlyD family efflux transporter periplasmic adaptor subunit [Alphaproteobacteria bacterium]|nr:HlyD family efflux transporter periplasmic adaptor subunit [Alphaproteobacteria bacterium]